MPPLSKYIQGKKILILDDCYSWLKYFSLWCSKNNLEHKTYQNVNEFLFKLPDIINEYDIAIVDYYLSDDYEAPDIIRRIRTINKEILIVTVSGSFKENKQYKTTEMIKAINAGSNRATPKCLESIQSILCTHLKVRELNLLKHHNS